MIAAALGASLSCSLVGSLASDCGAAAELARHIAERPNGTIDARSVGVISAAALARVADDFVRRNWLTSTMNGWRVGPVAMPVGVPSFLEGAAAMYSNCSERQEATAVVTMPPPPSRIAGALAQTGLAYTSLVSTRDAFTRMADKALGNLTFMTPFLNQEGIEFIIDLFGSTRAATRNLIVRQRGEAKRLVLNNAPRLAALGISAFDYTLECDNGFETFHAKVGLADSELAYVGSANMTVFARNSMELGLLAEGRAARVIANVVRAVTRVARPVPLGQLQQE